MDHLMIAKLLDTYRPQVVDHTVALALQNSFWSEQFGGGIGERLSLDVDLNLAAVAKAIRYRSPMILDDHVLWRRNQIIGFGCATGHIREIFGYKWQSISKLLPQEAQQTIYDYIQSSMKALSYPVPATQQIAAQHEQLAAELTVVTFDQNWHWQAAYGAEGRDELLAEHWFLIDYLNDAIGAKSQELIGRHVRRRRDKLIARGLSTMHMHQLLWMATQAGEHLLPPAAAAEMGRFLEAAAGFLAYPNESCSALLGAQDQIVGEVAGQLSQAGLAPQPDLAALEVGWYLAYLTDSIAIKDPASLVGYTRWMQHYFSSQGLPDTPLRQSFFALGSSIERLLPQYAAHDARTMLSAAQQTL